jgi:hypothetical protein
VLTLAAREMPEQSSFVLSILERCREFVSQSSEDAKFAKIVGLSAPSLQFEEDIANALIEVVFFHLAPKPLAPSQSRKQMLRLKKTVASASKAVRRVHFALEQVDPIYRDAIKEQKPQLDFLLKTLQSLSDLSDRYVAGFSRPGGAPKMIAFEILVRRLAAIFEKFTGRAAKVTWNAYERRYDGKFVNLVEAVLPMTVECAKQLGTEMPYPRTHLARGKYIFKVT